MLPSTLNPQPKVGLSQKWSWWLAGAIIYPSFSLQSLSHSSNGFSQRWSYKLELIAYVSGRKESFDCMRENQTSNIYKREGSKKELFLIFVGNGQEFHEPGLLLNYLTLVGS